jgi:hypothetical protein
MNIKYIGTSLIRLTTNNFYELKYKNDCFAVVDNYNQLIYYNDNSLLHFFDINKFQLDKLKIFSS